MKRYIEKEINNGVITNVITTYKRQINISLSAKHILHQGFMNHAQKTSTFVAALQNKRY